MQECIGRRISSWPQNTLCLEPGHAPGLINPVFQLVLICSLANIQPQQPHHAFVMRNSEKEKCAGPALAVNACNYSVHCILYAATIVTKIFLRKKVMFSDARVGYFVQPKQI